MNITEIEDMIDHPALNKDFRKLENIDKLTLYKKLFAEGLLRGRNSYFSYDTRSQVIGEIVKDIKEKINSEITSKESKDEVFAYIENASSRHLYLVVWHHPQNVSVTDIYKTLSRFDKLFPVKGMIHYRLEFIERFIPHETYYYNFNNINKFWTDWHKFKTLKAFL